MLSVIKNNNRQLLGGVFYKVLFLIVTSVNAIIMIKILPPRELGIWYIFMSLQTLVFILNNALIPNLARQYSLGIVEFKDGFNVEQFHRKTRVLYRSIVLLVFIICLLLTFLYLNNVIDIFSQNNTMLLYSWGVMVISMCFDIYYTSYECALNGLGEFEKVNSANFSSRLFLLIFSCSLILIHSQYSLLIFCIFYFLSNFFKRILILRIFKKVFYNSGDYICLNTEKFYMECRGVIYNLSFLSLLSSIGGVLIVRSGMFILPYYISLEKVGSYGVTYQLFEMGFNILFTIALIKTPNWIMLYKIKTSSRELAASFYKSKRIILCLMLLGGCVITFVGPWFLSLLNIQTKLLPTSLCILFIIVFVLQINHSVSGQLLTIQNKIPFAYASLVTGIVVIITSLFLIPRFGELGAILSILIAQGIYNNWKWPLAAKRFLNYESN